MELRQRQESDGTGFVGAMKGPLGHAEDPAEVKDHEYAVALGSRMVVSSARVPQPGFWAGKGNTWTCLGCGFVELVATEEGPKGYRS